MAVRRAIIIGTETGKMKRQIKMRAIMEIVKMRIRFVNQRDNGNSSN